MSQSIDEVKSHLKPAVFDFIDKIDDAIDREGFIVPTKELARKYQKRSGTLRIEVPQPSGLVRYMISREGEDHDFSENNLKEVARWIVESDNGYPLHYLSDDEPDSERINRYLFDLTEFAGEVMDYQSGLGYPESNPPHPDDIDEFAGLSPTDQAFDLAFETEIEPKYATTSEIEFLVPLNSFQFVRGELELKHHRTSWEEGAYKFDLVSNIVLAELTHSEISGLRTHYIQSHRPTEGIDRPPSPGFRHRLRFKFEVENRSSNSTNFDSASSRLLSVAANVVDNVVTSLRLFHPTEVVYAGTVYTIVNNWHSTTLDIDNFGSTRPQGPQMTSPPWDWYLIQPREKEYFRNFWAEYGEEFDKEDSPIAKPLRRFNQSYRKRSYEDRIVDYFLAFESSLLRDTDANYKFRLPSRAVLLLGDNVYYTNNYIFDVFDILREIRNQIVHSDANLENIFQVKEDKGVTDSLGMSDEDYTPRIFNGRIKYFLAEIILRYVQISKVHGLNITQTNQEVLEPAMEEMLQKPVDLRKYLP